MITLDNFNSWVSNTKNPQDWVDALNKILPDYDINTNERIAAFVAECSVESENFNVLEENLNYSSEGLGRTFPTHFAPDELDSYAHTPEKIANRVYANRMGNGDESSGDGWKYRGKGAIQLTGKEAQQDFADSLNMNVDDVPTFLGTFEGAIQSACFFWESRKLNQVSDTGDIDSVSRKINGGSRFLDGKTREFRNETFF